MLADILQGKKDISGINGDEVIDASAWKIAIRNF